MNQPEDEEVPRRRFFFNVPPRAFQTRQEVVESFPRFRRPGYEDPFRRQ